MPNQFEVTRFRINNVWQDVVIDWSINRAIRTVLAMCGSTDYTDYADQEKDLRNLWMAEQEKILRNLWMAFLFDHPDQKLAVTKPKFAPVTSDAGFAKFAWFVAFNASQKSKRLEQLVRDHNNIGKKKLRQAIVGAPKCFSKTSAIVPRRRG